MIDRHGNEFVEVRIIRDNHRTLMIVMEETATKASMKRLKQEYTDGLLCGNRLGFDVFKIGYWSDFQEFVEARDAYWIQARQ